jgi:hypothetical protein
VVDRAARNWSAELIRHVASGQMSISRFLDVAGTLADKTEDKAIGVVWEAVDGFYDDLFRPRPRLTPDERRRLTIMALFLYSDREYEWPRFPAFEGRWNDYALTWCCALLIIIGCFMLVGAFAGFLACAIGAAISGGSAWLVYKYSKTQAKRFLTQWEEEMREIGDYDVWPFIRQPDFDHARRHPPLLGGKRLKS